MNFDPASFIDGVPVKIGEAFRPPRRVTLPTSCCHQFNTEILAHEYDFTVERTTLHWIKEKRLLSERLERDRKGRIAEYDERKKRIKAEEEEMERQKQEELLKVEKEELERKQEEEELAKVQHEKCLAMKQAENSDQQLEKESNNLPDNDDDQTVEVEVKEMEDEKHKELEEILEYEQKDAQTTNDHCTQATEANVEVSSSPTDACAIGTSASCPSDVNSPYTSPSRSSYGDILLPLPASQHAKISAQQPMYNINFADFEADSNDPFDSLALRSINDLEELAKVLQFSNANAPASFTGPMAPQNQMAGINSHLNNLPSGSSNQPLNGHVYQFYGGQTVMTYATQNPYYNGQLGSVGQIGQIDQVSRSRPNYMPNVFPFYSSAIRYPSDGNSYPVIPVNTIPYPYHPAHRPSDPTVGRGSSVMVDIPEPVIGSGTANAQNLAPVKRPDLEDFFSRYYSKPNTIEAPPKSGNRSGDATPHWHGSPPTHKGVQGGLRSCRSVPDLTLAGDDEEVTQLSRQSDLSENNHRPPLFKRPSSTGLTGMEEWKLPVLPITPGQMLSPPRPVKNTKARLPDPFSELSAEAQVLVQGMAEMGFPRARVARAVQKLGVSHRKLIEVLLILQSLQEKGEDEYRSERAFYHYLGDIDKTHDHLVVSKQLLDLGFDEDRVIESLLKYNNDRDKALEELIA